MATKQTPILPVNVRRINSFMPCESCNRKYSRYEASLRPPGKERVSFRLCDRCISAIKKYD